MVDIFELAKREKPVFGCWISYTDPLVVEQAKLAGFDYVRIDNEYYPMDPSQVGALIRTANLLDMPVFVRVSRLEDITTFIAYGVDGIIVPDCDSVERAQAAIEKIKYYPLGARGTHPGSRAVIMSGLETKEYYKVANKRVSLTVQIEDINMLDHLDEIMSLEGIDMISSGRNDIAQSMGMIGENKHPKVMEFEAKLIEKAKEHGKLPVMLVNNKEELKNAQANGVNVFTICTDTILLDQGLRNSLAKFQ